MRNIYFTITTLLFLLGDIISKYLVENFLKNPIDIIPGILSLQKVYNSGIAFSLPIPLVLLKSMTVVLIFGIILYYFYERTGKTYGLYDLGFSLIIGGALGNAMGRILDGYVLDFIAVRYFSVFNIADCCICIGALLLIYVYWKQQKLTSN